MRPHTNGHGQADGHGATRRRRGAPSAARGSRRLLEALVALRDGDFSARLPVGDDGLAGKIADAVNDVAQVAAGLAGELRRLGEEVGKRGRTSRRAALPGARGAWAECVEVANELVADLAQPTAEITSVIAAVARGDLSRAMPLDSDGRPLEGEFRRTAELVNRMVEQLSSFASEVTRVAREVGTDGKLGGQARVHGAAGIWRDLTDGVNVMASNLTAQVRSIAEVTTAVAKGDLSRKVSVDVRGEILELKDTINTMVDQLRAFASEVTRVAREVGTEGRLGGQAAVPGVAGTWKDLTDSVNSMASNLTAQVRNIAAVTTAVATGDLSKKITVEVRGEIRELKDTINTMVDQLRAFASEVTRVAREVGTEGKLGGQARVPGVAGTWKDLTDSVNVMASNLTDQVRSIAAVVTAVAAGDLHRTLALDARGEIAALADTINGMIGTLATFADQVTGVAREVGIEGKLGGQARVPGAAGTWRDLTDNVNQLAANLTTQVRAIAEVATAVTKGDLTRSIDVSAQGEVAALKDNINQMIANLRATTQKSTEQDWLKTNLAGFGRMLQGQRDLPTVARLVLAEVAPLVGAHHGAFYVLEGRGPRPFLKLVSSYAHSTRKALSERFEVGEGLVGQCALEKERILVTDVRGDYVAIASGLGEAPPLDLLVLPVLFEGEVKAVVELASLNRFGEIHVAFLEELAKSIGIVLNTLAASTRTEELLAQSQSLAAELGTQQQELQRINAELEERSRLLELRNEEGERKNREIAQAKAELEERARQLALSSRYKSEFLANMSHELRTPLNSLLILAKLLAENGEGRLSPKEVEFAETIHGAGSDLLALIDEILDLSKVESGTMQVDATDCALAGVRDYVERAFRHVAVDKGLRFEVTLDPALPASFTTDARRLQQILRNLFSNAFKFTEHGTVALRIAPASRGWTRESLSGGPVIAFAVSDTGIGIPSEKQQVIFEAFQQADGTTARRYGGTGLGLSITRELARLLGGEVTVTSGVGEGSTFTLYLPLAGARGELREAPEAPRDEAAPTAPVQAASAPELPPPSPAPAPGARALLVVSDDAAVARTLCAVARARDLEPVVVDRGKQALARAADVRATVIALDARLPDIDGWAVLDRLKHDAALRHVPVEMICDGAEELDLPRAARLGAFGLVRRQASPDALGAALDQLAAFAAHAPRRALVAAASGEARREALEVMGALGVAAAAPATAREAAEALRAERHELAVVDAALADDDAAAIARAAAAASPRVPLVVLAATDLDDARRREVEARWDRLGVKTVRAPQALAWEATLHLHLPLSALGAPAREMVEKAAAADLALRGKTVLVVDDDMRNVFAVASALERHGVLVRDAESGPAALEVVRAERVDAVLMDVMMPEMDGYETMAEIRKLPRGRDVPIVALTAKAMKGDRERCLQAGASDYVTKPVDTEQLLSSLRVWLA
jgi:signal transduction histidine kinase/DNA-binding response OmpR family regulator/HAMP domain-containing protein